MKRLLRALRAFRQAWNQPPKRKMVRLDGKYGAASHDEGPECYGCCEPVKP